MRLIMPRAPRPLGGGYSWLRVSITQGKPELLASSLRQRAHHIAALIDTLHRSRPTLGKPIVAGFSQGAMLTFALALHRPDVVGRAFPLAGWVPPTLMPREPVSPERHVPIRSVHGAEDRIIPIEPTRAVMTTLRELGWEVELLAFEGVAHVISPEMNRTFEAWLEAALQAQAPELTGRGLGQPGPEEEEYEPWEPLDIETLEAIEQFEAQLAAQGASDEAGATLDEAGTAAHPPEDASSSPNPASVPDAAPGPEDDPQAP